MTFGSGMSSKKWLSFSLFIAFIFTLAGISSAPAFAAVNCWDNDGNKTACSQSSDDCSWHPDQWAPLVEGTEAGWCNTKGCWEFQDVTTCDNNNDSFDCQWQNDTFSSSMDGWCDMVGCWNFWDDESCSVADSSLGCQWDSTGNFCYPKGCGDYSSSECTTQQGPSGAACEWDSSESYCYEPGCWNYGDKATCDIYTNQSCKWDSSGNYCYELGCGEYNNDATGCQNSNMGCIWNDPWCDEQGCWNYDSNKTECGQQANCFWNNNTDMFNTGGWCNEVGCWNYDGDQSSCELTNDTLDCVWSDPWCDIDMSAGCSAFNSQEKDCYDTFYCIWDSEGDGGNGTCNEPTNFDFDDFFNPGCWIFDKNETKCNLTLGCTYDAGNLTCDGNATLQEKGIQCSNINSSSLCRSIPVLGTCCNWNGSASSCTASPVSTSCWDNMEEPPEGAMFCEDYNSYSSQALCEQIAGDPWYMPCKWDDSTGNCKFRAGDKGIDDINQITSKKDCEFAGGQWVQESYCEGNNTIPTGWCELKTGAGSKSCGQACWACEFQPNGNKWSDEPTAKKACKESTLGYCQWSSDSNALNGFGWCEANTEAGDCETSCSACTFNGDMKKGEPQQACKNSKASCKWFSDPLDSSKGWCDDSNVKSCGESCSSCYDDASCRNIGKGGNKSCTWETSGYCSDAGAQSNDKEICFDGDDNDNNGQVDCADSKCFSDPFCGGTFFGADCFMYGENTDNVTEANITCESNGCVWINDTEWGDEWCDFPGAQCWMNDENASTCNSAGGCSWMDKGVCDINKSKAKTCFTYDNNKTACDSPTNDCVWMENPWCVENPGQCDNNTGWCDFKIFECDMNWTLQTDQNLCTNSTAGCIWVDDPFMGGGRCSPPCFDFSLDSGSCGNISGGLCEWRNGFCEPDNKPEDCFTLESNKTACEDKSTCSWFPEPPQNQFCEVDTTSKCFEVWNKTECSNDALYPDCQWYNDTWNTEGWCEFKPFTCGMNQTKQANKTMCESELFCAWDGFNETQGWCMPVCFNQTIGGGPNNKTSCNTQTNNSCFWREGWCDPAMTGQMFKGMGDSPPVVLGGDDCGAGSISPNSSDLCGLGIKDDWDVLGFGMPVWSVKDAAICNGEKVFDNQDMKGNGATLSGTGNDLTRFYLYLDTDGSSTGGCNAVDENKNNITGFEFFFKYKGEGSSGEVSETRNAYKCDNNEWVITDIKFSSWNKLMCMEIGGGMLAVSKDDLKKYSSLYDSGKDMRIFAATANDSTDETNPLDSIGPFWYTPGTVDFMFEDCFSPGVDLDGDGLNSEEDPDCFFIQQMGFIPKEDCFENGVDEDADGLVDCNDPDCRFAPNCESAWENVNDTTAPKLTWKKVEAFPDSAFVMYDSDEPANGTLSFYYNDSTCSLNKTTILDPKMYDANNYNNYTSWHDGPMDNFTGNPGSLNNSLQNGTSYYYKLELCDPSGNCAVSACLNFTTPASASKRDCPDCEFVFKFNVPPGVDVGFDFGDGWQDQGQQGCGSSAGIYANYSTKESGGAKFKLEDTGNNSAIFLENITVKSISSSASNITSDDFKKGTTKDGKGNNIGYVGMDSQKFDQLSQELRPQKCRIRIPGTSTELWHCDDNLTVSSCIDMSSDPDVNMTNQTADYVEWEIPCDFSVWANDQPESAGSPGSPGNGGGTSTSPGLGGSGPSENKTDEAGTKIPDVAKNASKKGKIVPPGLVGNQKLQAALQKLLSLAQMNQNAIENLERLSRQILADVDSSREFRAEAGKSRISTTLKYEGKKKAKIFTVYDSVPKEFAEHVDNITVNAPGATVEIVEEDPSFAIVYDEISPGQELSWSYEVDGEKEITVLDSMQMELYAAGLEEEIQQPEPPKHTNYKSLIILIVVVLLAVAGLYYKQDRKKPFYKRRFK